MILHETFLKVSDEIWAKFRRTSQIPNKLNRGREREKIVQSFLDEFLPKQYSVGYGFTVATNNQESPEEDIVMYDEINNPLLSRFATLQKFPIESVYAIIEVKSVLNKKELKDSFKKIRAVKELPRVGGFTKMLQETVVFPPPSPPLGIVFAFKSTGLNTLKRNLKEFQRDVDPSYWINVICVLDKGVVFFGDRKNFSLSLHIDPASEPVILDSREDALCNFYVILEGYLNSADRRIVNIKAYAGISSKTSWIQEALNSLSSTGPRKVKVL